MRFSIDLKRLVVRNGIRSPLTEVVFAKYRHGIKCVIAFIVSGAKFNFLFWSTVLSHRGNSGKCLQTVCVIIYLIAVHQTANSIQITHAGIAIESDYS